MYSAKKNFHNPFSNDNEQQQEQQRSQSNMNSPQHNYKYSNGSPFRNYQDTSPFKESSPNFADTGSPDKQAFESHRNKFLTSNRSEKRSLSSPYVHHKRPSQAMQQQEQQFYEKSSNNEFFLQDLSAVEASLNESCAKPMLQNPIGLNQSYIANLSNNDVSKSKLDASINRYPFIELGQKQREAQQEYYELNPNHSYQNDDLKVRPIALSKGALSDVTDDTKDLSQMSLHHLKGNMYSQNNSYYLNNSTLQDPNRTKKHDSIMAKAADLSQKMDQHLKVQSHNNSINIVDNFVPIDNNTEIRHTANFGKNIAMNFASSQQPADLLSYVNSGADLNNSKLAKSSSESSNTFNNPVFTRQSELRSTHGIIPKESRGMTKGAAKEIEVILEGLETLELSKISSLSENFLEDEEENHAKHKNTHPQIENKEPVKPTMSFTENLAQKILADVKKNLDRPPAVKIESQYSSNTRAESQYNSNYLTHNNTKSDPQDFTLNNKNFFSAQLASPTNTNSNYLSNYQTNFTSIVAAPKIQVSDPALNQEDLTKRLTQIQTASPTKNSEQSTYRNLSIHSGHKFAPQFDSYRGPKTATYKESMTSEVLTSNKGSIQNEAFVLSNYKSLDRTPTNTTPNSNFKTPQRAAIMEASQMMERMQSMYKEFTDKNAELNDYVQELAQSPSRSRASMEPTYRASNSTIPKNSIGNNSVMRFNDDLDSNRQVRQTTHGFLESKARFSSYAKSPFDTRYSVRDPNTFDALPNEAAAMRTETNYQEFIKEDLLKDLDSPTHSKFMQSKLKTFSNPVFKKNSISSMSRDSTTPIPERLSSQSKRDYHQESMNLINKIFDTPVSTRPVKTETTPYEKKILDQSQEPLEARSQNITTAPSITVVENKSVIFDKQKSERPKVNQRTRRNLSSIFEDEVNVSVGGDEHTNVQLPFINYRSNKNLFNHTLFGFNVKQEKFIEGRSERKIQTDNMEIICINCQEFIKISKVDKHSQACDKSRQKSEEDQNGSIHHNISELNVKLFGIKDRIKHKSSSLGSKGPTIVESLNQITKLVDKIIDENDSANSLLGLIRQVEISLDQLSSHNLVDQDLGLLIYVNRILVLSQEKYNELEESEEDLTTLEDQIRAVQRETMRQRAELEVWQHQAKIMTQIKQSDDKNMKYVKRHYKKDNEVLSQIHSDIEASEKESSHGGTTETSGSGAISQVNFVAFKTSKENAQSENNKVKFYSLAVNIKLTLPSTHKGKDVLISDLYDVCLAEKVPEKEWDAFIRNKLAS